MQSLPASFGWIRQQSFLWLLTAAFTTGMIFSSQLEPIANEKWIRNTIVASVLFVMALPLETKSIGHTLRNPWAAVLGSVVNMALLPLVAWFFSRALAGDMRTGLLVAAAVPSTLASGAVWTRRAGGDDTVSIMITALTNVACFVVTPFLLYVSTGSEMSAEDTAHLARMPLRLAVLVVIPMAFAQLLRQNKQIGLWAVRRKSFLSKFAQAGILSMVMVGATQCSLKLHNAELSIGELPRMALAALLVHVLVFWCGMRLASALGFERPQQIAVGVSGSQKTLMVGLDIAIQYFGGLAMLPMVVYHFIQLFVDTMIADRLRSRS